MGFFGKVGSAVMAAVLSIVASDSKRIAHIISSPVTHNSPDALAGASGYTYGSKGVDWREISLARAKNRRAKGVNRFRSGRSG